MLACVANSWEPCALLTQAYIEISCRVQVPRRPTTCRGRTRGGPVGHSGFVTTLVTLMVSRLQCAGAAAMLLVEKLNLYTALQIAWSDSTLCHLRAGTKQVHATRATHNVIT